MTTGPPPIGPGPGYPFVGIHLEVDYTIATNVQGNTIQNIVSTGSSNLDSFPGVWTGIFMKAGNANFGTVTIADNTIGSGTGTGSVSVTTPGAGNTSVGIGYAGSGTVAIANNTIGSITVNGTSATSTASLIGIQVTGGAAVISNNTVGSTTTANSLNAATSSTSSLLN